VALDRALIAALVERIDRRMAFELSMTEGHVYLTIAGETLEGVLERRTLTERAEVDRRQEPLR
jgi:hypothetical protein